MENSIPIIIGSIIGSFATYVLILIAIISYHKTQITMYLKRNMMLEESYRYTVVVMHRISEANTLQEAKTHAINAIKPKKN